MTAQIVVSCDAPTTTGPCRGAIYLGTLSEVVAGQAAGGAGWTVADDESHRCPGHRHVP